MTVGLLAFVPLFDVGGDADRLDIREFKPALVAPSKNRLTARAYAMRVLRLRLAVKEFDGAAAGVFAVGADNHRQRVEAGRYQRRRRRLSRQ